MIETPRLILRRWRDGDREAFAAINADPRVADWLGGPMTRQQSDDYIARAEATFDTCGYGRLALERRDDGRLIGAVGLAPVHPSLPFEGVEIGWRLAHDTWGLGYATEAARATVEDAFHRVGLAEVVSFTADINARSEAVMRRIGLQRDPSRDFDNPNLAEGHPLRRHIVYAARNPGAPVSQAA